MDCSCWYTQEQRILQTCEGIHCCTSTSLEVQGRMLVLYFCVGLGALASCLSAAWHRPPPLELTLVYQTIHPLKASCMHLTIL